LTQPPKNYHLYTTKGAFLLLSNSEARLYEVLLLLTQKLFSPSDSPQELSLLTLDKRISLNGSHQKRVANNINISIDGFDSEIVFLKLDKAGVACATKSACLSSKEEGSYVLKALGHIKKDGIRFSLGKETTKDDVDQTIQILGKILNN